ncbi:hypothetical protein RM844_15050 [Streptomyces sp. DSM 44915]|uniref:Lipoprotein n=1 Tax=Streptomyces chisholmiae TaxID=3075540 RepID=A0ABU2JSY4_9ACTN|nr:hypothetical protein [Streptomyces sp. DSM 44915]MDT0267604.1 hypothetical protein [Streptomyces sp. DSM 44915]
MRSSIRLAVPAVAAAMLLLSACGGDDEGDEGGTLGIGEEQQEGGAEEGAEEGESAGDTGGDAGGEPAGEAPTAEELEGFWATGLEDSDAALTFSSGTVTFVENTAADMTGAVCFGTVAGATITLECDTGATDWSEGTLALDGGDLNVTWASGTTQTFQSLADAAGLENLPDMGDLGGLEDLPGLEEDLADLEQELADLGY